MNRRPTQVFLMLDCLAKGNYFRSKESEFLIADLG
jgi:hypothetical protein